MENLYRLMNTQTLSKILVLFFIFLVNCRHQSKEQIWRQRKL